MKPLYTLGVWIALTFSVSSVSAGADNSSAAIASRTSGSITGRVQNVVTGQYLNNARISVRGTDVVVSPIRAGPTSCRMCPVAS